MAVLKQHELFDLNSATKVEFCLLKQTAVNGSQRFQVFTIIVRYIVVVPLYGLELCKETKSYFCSAKKQPTALKYLLPFHQNRKNKKNQNAPLTIPELGLLDIIGFLEVRLCKTHHCTIEPNLGFSAFIFSLTMSSQEPPKQKSKRDYGLFCLYSKCTCVDVMHFVSVCTSAYHMEKNKSYNGS